MEIALTRYATSAVWHALQNRKVTGRVEARRHSKVMGAMRTGKCFAVPDEKFPDQINFEAGAIALEKESAEYLADIVDDRLDEGVPGINGAGYGDLVDSLYAAGLMKDDAEVAKK